MKNGIVVPLNIPGVNVVGQSMDENGNLIIHTENAQEGCEFPSCNKTIYNSHGYRNERSFRHTSVFGIKSYINIRMFLFDDRLYNVDSEPELKRRYADMTLIIRPNARQYEIFDFLLEFKFVTLGEAGLSGEQARELSPSQLQASPAVQAAFAEAEGQLREYGAVLRSRHGEMLRLRVYAVVAVGFERLAWREI